MDNKIKEGINSYIGEENLYTNQFRNRLLFSKPKSKTTGIPLFNKLKPVLALAFLIVGGVTYFILSNDLNDDITTVSKDIVDKPIFEELKTEPITENANEEFFKLDKHGLPFPELENDLNHLMSYGYQTDQLDSRNVEVLANSLNGVAIDEKGTLVVEFKDFRNEFGSLTSNEMGVFLWPLHDTVFKYAEVKRIYFTFEGSFTDWYMWLQSGPEPMVRNIERYLADNKVLFDELIKNHAFHKNMYQKLQEANMPNKQAAAVFILYIEALRNNDVYGATRFSSSTESEIADVLEKYDLMDYTSLSIESITPSQGEPEYLVRLNFKQKDGSTGSKSIFIQFWSPDEITIADHIKIDNVTY